MFLIDRVNKALQCCVSVDIMLQVEVQKVRKQWRGSRLLQLAD